MVTANAKKQIFLDTVHIKTYGFTVLTVSAASRRVGLEDGFVAQYVTEM